MAEAAEMAPNLPEDDPGRMVEEEGAVHKPAGRLTAWAEAYALLGLAVITVVFFAFLPSTSEAFPTAENFQTIAGGQAVLAIATLAVLVPLSCDEYDLSVGAKLGLASVVVASLMAAGLPLVVCLIAGLVSGALIGVVNGLLVTRVGVNAVIVTLGVSVIIHGLVQLRTGGKSITEGIPTSWLDFGSATLAGIPVILLAALVVISGVYYLLVYTPYGRQLYMVGANRQAAKLAGLRVDWLLFTCFVVGGFLAGIAGALQVARAGAAAPAVGETFTLPAFAAAFLSAAAVKPGRYNVWGAVVAISFLAILNGGLNIAGAAVYIQDFVNGTALIAGVALAVFLRRRRGA
ncbi:MAG: ABC transporter permease [Solirubrobacterales bacterium]